MLPKPSPKPFEPKYPAVLQSIGEMSQRRVDLCNKLPTYHPLQPPGIIPLNMIPANNPKPSQTTQQTPLQEGQSSAAAEGSEDPEELNTSDLPHCDSPSNLFSLERHLGGEITKTPQKATKSFPKQIDLVNQQPHKPTHQTNPELTPTPTQTQTHTSTQQMTIPEPVVETVVTESVLVTEFEPLCQSQFLNPHRTYHSSQMTNPYHHHHSFRSLNNHPQTSWNLNSSSLSC